MSDAATLQSSLGFLTDRQIKAALDTGVFLEQGTWEVGQLRHASYTLRLGDRVEVARASSAVLSETKEFTIVNLTTKEPRFALQPGDTALLFSMENLRIPENILGFTVARGLLFAEALCPENTYVDPGFSGKIYITVTNVSGRVVHLEYGMQIARLFFYRLSEDVQDGYKTGAALGISQQLKSVRTTAFSTPQECRSASDTQLLECIQQIPIGGIHAAEILRRRGNIQGHLWVAIVCWPVLLIWANSSMWVRNTLGMVFGNVAVTLLASGLIYVAPKVAAYIAKK
jgi:deoxycytidine triphosphate deaminase